MTNEIPILLNSSQSLLLFVMHGKLPFGLIYLLTLVLSVIIFLAVGFAKKFPVSTWTTIVATVAVAFLAGLVLYSYPVKSWIDIFSGNYGQVKYIKYAPGGFLFAVIALLIIRKVLHFKPSIGDTFIIFLPVLAIIQRIGCLVNGCCYGKPSELPWAVHYPATSPLFQTQLDAGLIHIHDPITHGVHPTQLYMILGYLLVIGLLLITRKRFTIPGTRSLFGISLLAIVRFMVEFWREPNQNAWYSTSWLGLTFLQWAILVFLGICSIIAYWSIYKTDYQAKPIEPVVEKPFLNFTIIFLLLVVIWQIRELFDFFEILVLTGIFTFSYIMVFVRIFQKITIPSLRWISATMMLVAFFAMSQQIVEAPKDSVEVFKKREWFGIGINAGAGTYHEITRDCYGNITGEYDRNYLVYGGDFTYHLIPSKNQHLTAGVNVFHQQDRRMGYTGQDYYNYNGTIFNPYFLYDFKIVGVGGGIHLSTSSFNSLFTGNIAPVGYLRIGKRDKFFTEFALMQYYYKNGAYGMFQMGLGTGFGEMDRNTLRGGLGFFPNERIAVYLDGCFFVSKDVAIKPAFAIGDEINGSLGLQVLLGNNKK
jgi:phosphatidylglycerol:prolipoprotein diacylglycerol transferase